jgi:hypothetical protein
MMVYTMTVTPFLVFFLDNTSDSRAWVGIELTVSAVFFVDVIMNFNLAYEDSSGRFVTDRCVLGVTAADVPAFPSCRVIHARRGASSGRRSR